MTRNGHPSERCPPVFLHPKEMISSHSLPLQRKNGAPSGLSKRFSAKAKLGLCGWLGEFPMRFLTFTLFGPGVGFLTIWVVLSLDPGQGLLHFNEPAALALAYIFGVWPAMFTAGVDAWVSERGVDARVKLLLSAIAGFVAGYGLQWVVTPSWDHRIATYVFGIGGFVAGLVCSLITREVRRWKMGRTDDQQRMSS
jgi:hypothetical protein